MLDQNFIQKHFERYNISSLNEFYEEIGKKQLNIKTVINKILSFTTQNTSQAYLEKQMARSNQKLTHQNDTGIIIEGLKNPHLKLASCCSPVWGDEVTGFLTKGRGIVIHRKDCINLKAVDDQRVILATWTSATNVKYSAWISLIATSKDNLTQQVINKINGFKISILELNVINNQKLETIIKLRVLTANIKELNTLIVNLYKIPQIHQIQRGNY